MCKVNGLGPLGQAGVRPSGTVERNYQTEFLGVPHGTGRDPSFLIFIVAGLILVGAVLGEYLIRSYQ